MVFYNLSIGNQISLKSESGPDSVIFIESASFNPQPSSSGGFDNTSFYLKNKEEDVLLVIAPRYSQNAIVFNSRTKDGSWGAEERETLEGKFTSETPNITVYEHPDRYQILFDYKTVKYYNKRLSGKTASIAYHIQKDQESMFSDPVGVNTYDSFADFVGRK